MAVPIFCCVRARPHTGHTRSDQDQRFEHFIKTAFDVRISSLFLPLAPFNFSSEHYAISVKRFVNYGPEKSHRFFVPDNLDIQGFPNNAFSAACYREISRDNLMKTSFKEVNIFRHFECQRCNRYFELSLYERGWGHLHMLQTGEPDIIHNTSAATGAFTSTGTAGNLFSPLPPPQSATGGLAYRFTGGTRSAERSPIFQNSGVNQTAAPGQAQWGLFASPATTLSNVTGPDQYSQVRSGPATDKPDTNRATKEAGENRQVPPTTDGTDTEAPEADSQTPATADNTSTDKPGPGPSKEEEEKEKA
ncbi:uncharacterized protein KY384_004741 [Bacidia gigantensis]|uniref:uncharacterized protein n=1 Tax=Bacidia gigantensis TaxID=2732470 RepID=UPI001D03E2D0|nr:uncharacterized protein KY384_004741 [Bacidia gigantensis]KAG8530241.1 hypothetical protein KY384_004741 [Bacidia gigantensis]